MKEFIKMTLAVICGLIIVSLLSIFIVAGMASTISLSSQTKTVLPKSGVLLMDMSKYTIGEQSKEQDPVSMIKGDETQTLGLWNVVQAINIASEDPGVKYIYLKTDGMNCGISQLQEIRASLKKCKENGKAVIAYTEQPSTGSYYLASVADKVYMTSFEGGSGMITGVGSQLIFIKDLLDKVGINMQLIRHGKYKSAGEMFIKNAPSPENLEQNQAMIDALWNTISKDIAESREISVGDLNDMVDNLKLNLPQDYIDNKLVDGLLSGEELKSRLADLAVVEKYKDIKFINFADYISSKVLVNFKAKQKIAIIYADGEIVDGKQKDQVAGDRLASEIAKVRADSTIKAVVFRVNSPGGSVLASEKIKSQMDLLCSEKPVIASYGSYAASGGYWISNNCKKIYADATTLTGSIGVFSMIPDLSKAVKDKLHVNLVTVGSNKHSDLLSGMRPLDADEIAYMQASVENIYEKFVSIVAQGRSLTEEFVDSIAQGRVWAGSDALEIGLVDELGTLEDAINCAVLEASEDVADADISKWRIVSYPKPQTSMEKIMEALGQTPADDLVFEGTFLESTEAALRGYAETLKDGSKSVNVARMPFALEIKL